MVAIALPSLKTQNDNFLSNSYRVWWQCSWMKAKAEILIIQQWLIEKLVDPGSSFYKVLEVLKTLETSMLVNNMIHFYSIPMHIAVENMSCKLSFHPKKIVFKEAQLSKIWWNSLVPSILPREILLRPTTSLWHYQQWHHQHPMPQPVIKLK